MEFMASDPDLERDEFAEAVNSQILSTFLTKSGVRAPMGSRLVPAYGFQNETMEGSGLYGGYDSASQATEVGVAADKVTIRPSKQNSGGVLEIEPAGTPDVDVPPSRLSLHGTDPSDGNETLTRWDLVMEDELRQTTYSRIGGTIKDFLWTKDVDGTVTELMRLTTAGVFTVLGAGFQPLDATLTAFAALTIAANSLTVGTGADAFSQTTFAANTFPARSSAGNLEAKTITDFGLSLADDANAAAGRTTLGLGSLATLNTVGTSQIDDEAVTLAKLEHFAANTILLRNAGTAGDPDDVKISALTEESAPAAGDYLLMEESGGNLRKVNWSSLPSSGSSDLVYVGTPANFDVSEVTDVQIVSRAVTSVGSTDQLIVEGWCTILNDSAATRAYTFTLDFNSLFDVEITTGILSASAADEHPIYFAGTLSIRSTSLSYATFELRYGTNTAKAAGADPGVSSATFSETGWNTHATDVSGTTTVTLHVRSTNANATQTLRLHHFTIRKVTPT